MIDNFGKRSSRQAAVKNLLASMAQLDEIETFKISDTNLLFSRDDFDYFASVVRADCFVRS